VRALLSLRREGTRDCLRDLLLQGTPGDFSGHQAGDHIADLGEPPEGLGVARHEEVEPALRAVMNRARPRSRLVEDLLGLRLGAADRSLGLLVRIAD
jgi:hypothetical protein